MENILKTLTLERIRGIPQRVKARLVLDFGSAEKVFDLAKNSSLIRDQFGPLANSILSAKIDFDPYKKELDEALSGGIEAVTIDSAGYPQLLRNIDDPPLLFYKKGLKFPEDKLYIAVVGSRSATKYGKDYAYSISKELAGFGVTVVSGMAYGIDSVAHKGCLDGKGFTVAVLGNGILKPYPLENRALFNEIIESGAVISEFPPSEEPLPHNFPKRNRIISGLSHGVFVVEASIRSGARITARLALEQDRDTFALPGPVYSATSAGTNELIKLGHAKLTTSVKDILIEFAQFKSLIDSGNENREDFIDDLTTRQKNLICHLKKGETVDIDSLGEKTGLKIEEILDIILELELKGVISRSPGNAVSRGT